MSDGAGAAGGAVTGATDASPPRIMAVGGDTIVWLWDISEPNRTASPFRELPVPTSTNSVIPALAFTPDGTMLAVAGPESVELWGLTDPDHPQWRGLPGTIASTLVFVDGRTLVVSGPNTPLAVWDVTDPLNPHQNGGTPPGGGHQHVAITHAADLLATADNNGGAVIWDINDRTQPRALGPVLQDGDTVAALAFTPDGQSLATATTDGRTRLRDLRALRDVRLHAVEIACHIAGRGLTPDEWARYITGLDYVDSCR